MKLTSSASFVFFQGTPITTDRITKVKTTAREGQEATAKMKVAKTAAIERAIGLFAINGAVTGG